MKKSSKKTLEKRGILIAGRAQNAGGAQIHADKRRTPRNLEKQRLKTQLQTETARNRGPFPFLGLDSEGLENAKRRRVRLCDSLVFSARLFGLQGFTR